MLTLERLKQLGDNEIFLKGEVVDSPDGVNMTNSGRQLAWVAVAGNGYPDWTIYCHWSERSSEWIAKHGDKITREEWVKKLVPCNDEAYQMFRR